jgi:hypothetical protein
MDDVESWILHNYRPDSIQLKQLCQTSCVFIRFKIVKGGKVSDLAFNKNLPGFITGALTEAIESMNRDAIISGDLQSDQRTYLLPFIYDYRAGCENVYQQKDANGNTIMSQLLGEAVVNMLNFTDKKMMALDCVILNPISIGNVLMY